MLVAGVVFVVVHARTSDAVATTPSTTAVAVFLVSGFLGHLLHRPPFFVFATTFSTSSFLFSAFFIEDSPDSRSAEILILAGLSCLIVGLARFYTASGTSRRNNVLSDGLIVALGTWLVAWIVLVQPSIETRGVDTTTVLRATVLALSIIVLFFLAVLIFSNTARSVATTFFAIAIVSALVGVIVRAISYGDMLETSELTRSLPFFLAGSVGAAAMLHPSSHGLVHSSAPITATPLMYRLVTTTMSLSVPIVLLALTDSHDTRDRLVRTTSAGLLAIVIMFRVVQSVRENSRAQDRLMRNALTDSLTGLPNRILMLEHISTALRQSWFTSRQPTVLFIDVDRFKNINDSLGHSAGDTVLTHVASRILLAVPDTASVARISGDEFIVVDPTTQSPTQSVMLAEKILDSLRTPLSTSQGDMFVTASIGVAYAPSRMDLDAETLVQHADTAMYRAKAAGRNCIALFDDTMLESVTKRLSIETALYGALERGELVLVYQPIIDMTINTVVGFEALMRWRRTDGQVPPSEFIPIAEETGIIVPIGTWALRDALGQLRSWMNEGMVGSTTTMSVNVSPAQLLDPDFVSQVHQAVVDSSLAPDQLVLEVTESIMISEASQALTAMRSLASLGVRLAVDDFGTGYSSLSVLQHFPLHVIKIDRSFIDNVQRTDGGKSLVRTIVAMAHALDADVIAEGVESTGQVASLVDLHCTKAQGYLFAHPVTPEEIPGVVRDIEDRDAWLD